jgi:hypothetical protein
VKESSSQAGEKGSNDDEVSLHFNEIIEFWIGLFQSYFKLMYTLCVQFLVRSMTEIG